MPPSVAFRMVLPLIVSRLAAQRSLMPQPVSGAAVPSGASPMTLPWTTLPVALGAMIWTPS